MFCRYSARKKNIASIANDTMKATMFAPEERPRAEEREVDHRHRRAALDEHEADQRRRPRRRAGRRSAPSPSPTRCPRRARARARSGRRVIVAMPGSRRRRRVSSRDSRVANSVTATAAAATGRLRKKIDCQETCSTSKPPTHRPDGERDRATRRPMSRSPCRAPAGGNALVMIESVAGIINAAPDALDRAPGDEPGVGLARSRSARSRRAKMTTPKRNTRRRPKMSPRRPPVTSSTAKASV